VSLIKPPFGFNVGSGGVDGSFYGDLQGLGLTTNLTAVWDAGALSSYSSGERWYDLVSSQVLMLGSETASASTGNEPVFTGTPGGLSSGEYFVCTNGDEFFKAETMPVGLKQMHHAGAVYSYMVWWYNIGSATNDMLFNTTTSGNAHGIYVDVNNNRHQLIVRTGSGNALSKTTALSTIPTGAWHLLGGSIDEASGGSTDGFFYLDGGFHQVSAADQFDPTYTSPSSTDSTLFHVGCSGSANQFMPAGTRYAGLMFWDGTALSKAQMDTIWNQQKTRFGL
jgi:hypothetical protein